MTWWKPWTWTADPKWAVLSGLPTVQFRMVFLSLLDLLTLVGIAHTIETVMHKADAASRADPLVLEIWIAWLTLLGGLHGLGYAGYRTKRATSSDGNLTEDAGEPPMMTREMPVVVPPPKVETKVETTVTQQPAKPEARFAPPITPSPAEPSD